MRQSRHWSLLAAAVALSMGLTACGSSANDSAAGTETESAPLALETESQPPASEETLAPAEEPSAAFDMVSAVNAYASTIPDGFFNVGDITAFKDALTVEGTVLIDVREPSEYADGHIPGAVNIPIRALADNLDKIPTDRPVFVYCASGWRAGIATSSLHLMGYDNVLAYGPSYKGWTEAGETVETTENVAESVGQPTGLQPELVTAVGDFLRTIPDGFYGNSVDQVKEAIAAGAVIVDVREPSEYDEGHIADALNVPVRTVAAGAVEVPTDVNTIVHCASGWRASLALPMYHVLGYSSMSAFPGSYKAWTAAGEPVVTA